ncbi:putative lipoyl synthase [Rosa chinensis]|uniref:Putative lipoyl synthase n=1 Tax=Rosa chinensis TaxID=74649 RepID=A0A2P6QT93_ROSCH|nr:putative lipoyl synthase [Rosa chinensis]
MQTWFSALTEPKTLPPDPSPPPRRQPPPPPNSHQPWRASVLTSPPSLPLTEFVEGEGPYSVEVGTKKKLIPKPKWMELIPAGEKYM